MKCKHKWATAIHCVTFKWCGYVCERCGKCTNNLGHARFWNWLLRTRYRQVVKVKSLLPYFAEGLMWWPTLLVDDENNQRKTTTPGWNMAQIKARMTTQSKGDSQ